MTSRFDRLSAFIAAGMLCVFLGCLGAGCACCSSKAARTGALREALTFHASFDRGPAADFALGDSRIYTAPAYGKQAESIAGLHTSNVTVVVEGQGRFGNALHFTQKKAPMIFFKAAGNQTYRVSDWSGAVSFWLNVDPETELEQGFCDPLQITPRAWNDAAFFVEFEKRQEIPFRLGVYADYPVWNPNDRKWETIAPSERPLVTVRQPPFARGKWTHVVFTFQNFNSGRPDGVAKLYLDGQLRGELSGRQQTFTWDLGKTAVMLGLGYVGRFDELSLFKRALTAAEVAELYSLPKGVTALVH